MANWREKYPDLEQRFAEAREQARQKALIGIKAAGEAGDWRAHKAFLEVSFPEYRQNTNVEVNANAAAGNLVVQITPEQIAQLQARWKKLQEETR